MIKDVAFIAYAVRNLSQAFAFYQDVVGLKPEGIHNEEFAEFGVGSTTFAIDGSPPGYEPGNCAGVAFEVDDLVEARERLRRNDVPVTEIFDFPTCSACFAKDPDGNSFALHKRRTMAEQREDSST